jgi:hypothetical protein
MAPAGREQEADGGFARRSAKEKKLRKVDPEEARQNVLDSLSDADLENLAKARGMSLVRRTAVAGVHVHMPSFTGAAFACMCGYEGAVPCPSAPRAFRRIKPTPRTQPRPHPPREIRG